MRRNLDPIASGGKKLNEAGVLVNLFRLTKPQKSYKLKKIRSGEKNRRGTCEKRCGRALPDMIEELLKKIRETEAEADRSKRAAEEKSAAVRAEADLDAKKIAEEYAKNSRAQFEKITAEATVAADEEYAREIEKAEAECAKLIENNEKRAEELAAALLGRVKDGDL